LLVGSVTVLCAGLRAADLQPAQQCADIAVDIDRLACYDRRFPPSARSSPAPATTSPSRAADPATHEAAAAVGADARRDFGLSEADKRRHQGLPTDADSISVTIQSISRRLTGEQVFETTEGQVWVEIEATSHVRLKPGETVTIRRAALGSYVLVTSKRAGTKVRRSN
jgi:Protein of unknown function (DUF3121).